MKCNIDPILFWNYTIGELKLIIESYAEKEQNRTKEIIANDYNKAVLISSFIGRCFNGENIPSINEIYPDMFPYENVVDDKSWILYKEQFLDFANEHNKRLNLQSEE